MKEITKLMIVKYELLKLKYDFMGYPFQRTDQLSFHHLIVPHRECKKKGLGEGYVEWNGAILRQKTSHDYLHIVERCDRDRFLAITNHMIEENKKGYLDPDDLKAIDDILYSFEKEYLNKSNKKGGSLIRPEYMRRVYRNK